MCQPAACQQQHVTAVSCEVNSGYLTTRGDVGHISRHNAFHLAPIIVETRLWLVGVCDKGEASVWGQ